MLLELMNASEGREDDKNFKNPVDLLFDRLEAKEPEHFALKQYKKYKLAAGDIRSKGHITNVLGNATDMSIREVRHIAA